MRAQIQEQYTGKITKTFFGNNHQCVTINKIYVHQRKVNEDDENLRKKINFSFCFSWFTCWHNTQNHVTF